MIDKHFFEQMVQKVEPESFLYEFLNSGDRHLSSCHHMSVLRHFLIGFYHFDLTFISINLI